MMLTLNHNNLHSHSEYEAGEKGRNAHLWRSTNYKKILREKERLGFGTEQSSDPLPSACAHVGVACFIYVSQLLFFLVLSLCYTLILRVQLL